MFLSGFSDINWKALCTIIDRLDLQQQYPTIFDRLNLENMTKMYKEIEKWTMAHTYEEIYNAVMDYNKNVGEGVVVPGKISSPEDTINADNWWIRKSFEKIDDPYYGELTIANQAWKMTESPPRVKWLCRPLGADNSFIYNTRLGFGEDDLAALKKKGVI